MMDVYVPAATDLAIQDASSATQERKPHRQFGPMPRQRLSAISRRFDWLVWGGVIGSNPATSVRRPRHVVRVGKTPALSDEEAPMLLESIPRRRSAVSGTGRS